MGRFGLSEKIIASLITFSLLVTTVGATAQPAFAELKAPPKGTAKVVPEKPEDLKSIEGLTLDTDLDVQPGEELEPEPGSEPEADKATESADLKDVKDSEKKEEDGKKADETSGAKDKKDSKKGTDKAEKSKKEEKPADQATDKPAEEKPADAEKPTSMSKPYIQRIAKQSLAIRIPGTTQLPNGPFLSDSVAYVLAQTTPADEKKEATNPIVFVEGSFTDNSRRLFIGFDPVRITKDKRFKIAVPVSAAETTIELISRPKAGQGADSVARYVIKFRDWKKFSGDPKVRNASDNHLIVGGSFGSFSYDEDGEDPASQIALSVYGVYQREIRPRIHAKGSVGFTLLPISGKPEGFRFLKVTLGGVYETWKKDVWDLNLGFSLRYLRMLVSSDSFGFSNVFGYQIVPQIQRKLSSGNLVSGYLLIGPAAIYNGIIPGSGNMEFGVGATYYLIKEGKRPIGITLEFSSLSVDIDSRPVSASQILLGGSYGLF